MDRYDRALSLWFVALFVAFAMVLLLGVTDARAQVQPTVTVTASPTTGACPLSSTITWSSTAAQSCSKTGAWSGTAALSGNAAVTLQTGSATYGINCQTNTGPLSMSWTAPTTNEDGSPLTDLAGYDAYHAATAAGVTTAAPVAVPLGTSATLTVPIGPRYVAMKSRNTAGARSTNFSNTAGPTTVNPKVAGGSVDLSCTTVPNPPTGVVTTSTQAYDLNPGGQLGKVVGRITLGVPCGPLILMKQGKSYHELPLDLVTLTTMPRSPIVVGVCEAT